MLAPLWIAKTGLDAQQTRMEVIANNIANVNTTGFKSSRASFEDLIYQDESQPGAQSTQQTDIPTGTMIGTGVRVVGTEKLFTQGNLTQTGNALDVAIEGQGFLQVTMPDGSIAYTRDGALQLNENGQLVTADGYQISPPINIPPNAQSITIGTDGTVSATLPGQANASQIGTMQLATFVNPAGLEPVGQNLYTETTSSGAPQIGQPDLNGFGSLQQGSLETSNVNVVSALVDMIETQRAYEMNSKVVSSTSQMLQDLTQDVGS